jgi:hypothetical protein
MNGGTWYIHAMKYSSAFKRKEIMTPAANTKAQTFMTQFV